MKLISASSLMVLATFLILGTSTSAQHLRVVRQVDMSSLGDISTLLSSVFGMMMPLEVFSTFTQGFRQLFTLPTEFLTQLNSLGSLGRKRRAVYPWSKYTMNKKQLTSENEPTPDVYEHSDQMFVKHQVLSGVSFEETPASLERVAKRVARDVVSTQGESFANGEVSEGDAQSKGMEVFSNGMEAMGNVAQSGAMMERATSDVAKSGENMAQAGAKTMEMFSSGAQMMEKVASEAGNMATMFG